MIIPFLFYCLAVGAVAVPKINITLAILCIQRKDHLKGFRHTPVSSEDICVDPAVHIEMARFIGYGNLISGILCAFSSPQLGKLSDRYGRKPLIAFSAFGILSGDAISIIAAWFPTRISVYWILLEFVIGGLTGALMTTIALIQSYITDISIPEVRPSLFSLLHACTYIGSASGPAIGALLVQSLRDMDLLAVLYVSGVCHLFFIIYVFCIIPESLICPHPRTGDLNDTNLRESSSSFYCWRHIHNLNPLAVLSSSQVSPVAFRTNLRILASIDAISLGIQIGLPSLLVLYSEYQLQWKHVQATYFFSATNLVRATILALMIPAAIKYMTTLSNERLPNSRAASVKTPPIIFQISLGIIQIALLLASLSNLGLALSTGSSTFVLAGILAATGAPVSPLAQSYMTHHVAVEKVGELFGAISSLHAASRALIPALMQMFYSLTLLKMPEFVFWVLSVLSGVAFLASLGLSR